MLDWLFPRPPLRPWETAWTEYRFGWLIETFGADRLREASVVLPHDDFFPDVFKDRPHDAEAILRRLAKYMRVPPDSVDFQVLPDNDLPAAAGHYDHSPKHARPVIRVARSQLDDPEALVATLAHELAHELLLGGGRLTGEETDHEWVTDLLPAFLGLGMFGANSTIRFASGSSGVMHWWNVKRQGYLPSRIHGYALALFAWLREDDFPRWMKQLRPDAREAMRGGLRYLRRAGDCCLDPEAEELRVRLSPDELLHALSHGSPSARIIAMWDARDEGHHALAAPVQKLLKHRAADVRCEAVRVLAAMNEAAPQDFGDLASLLRDHDDGVKTAAANAAQQLQPESQAVVYELGLLLDDATEEVAYAAAAALRAYGRRAREVESRILQALHQAIIDCNYSLIDLLIDALRKISDDAGQSINDYFTERDPEFRQMAIDALYRENESGMI